MLYRCSGRLKVVIWCDCPNCGGSDTYSNGELVAIDVESDTPEGVADTALKEIRSAMSHDDAVVEWRDEPVVTELGVDVILRKLKAAELPLGAR